MIHPEGGKSEGRFFSISLEQDVPVSGNIPYMKEQCSLDLVCEKQFQGLSV